MKVSFFITILFFVSNCKNTSNYRVCWTCEEKNYKNGTAFKKICYNEDSSRIEYTSMEQSWFVKAYKINNKYFVEVFSNQDTNTIFSYDEVGPFNLNQLRSKDLKFCKNGLSLQYYSDGNIKYLCHYDNDTVNGQFLCFNRGGKLQSISQYEKIVKFHIK